MYANQACVCCATDFFDFSTSAEKHEKNFMSIATLPFVKSNLSQVCA